MDNGKAKQEISVIGRLFSMEALLILMGLISLVSGIVKGQATQIFFGVVILAGSVALYFVRKKDWKKHWEELEAEGKARDKDKE
jgi:flagellar biosynthesis component FlhA